MPGFDGADGGDGVKGETHGNMATLRNSVGDLIGGVHGQCGPDRGDSLRGSEHVREWLLEECELLERLLIAAP